MRTASLAPLPLLSLLSPSFLSSILARGAQLCNCAVARGAYRRCRRRRRRRFARLYLRFLSLSLSPSLPLSLSLSLSLFFSLRVRNKQEGKELELFHAETGRGERNA